MNERSDRVLDLSEIQGPELALEASSMPDGITHSGTPLALGIFSVLTLLCGLVLVPVSHMATGQPGQTWSLILEELMDAVGALGASPQEAPTPLAEAPASDAASLGGDPFSQAALSPLKGAYCMDYMPGGNNARAASAFNQLVWSKLNKELQEIVDERLDVCMPFEKANAEVVTAGGCAKSQCGVNDVNFFINQQGQVAVQYRVNGECHHAAENGFSQTDLLCR